MSGAKYLGGSKALTHGQPQIAALEALPSAPPIRVRARFGADVFFLSMNSKLAHRIKSFRGPQAGAIVSLCVLHGVSLRIFAVKGFGRAGRGAPGFSVTSTSGKPICEPGITLVASGLPTFCGLPLAKRAGIA